MRLPLPIARLRLTFLTSLALFATGPAPTTLAQTVVWSDDFESYEPQEIPAAESLGLWTEGDGTLPTAIDGLLAQSGLNSLRLDEGPGGDTNGDGVEDLDDNDGAGALVFLDLPETYTSGAYSLTFSQYIEDSMDSLQRLYVSQQSSPNPSTGFYIYFDAQGLFFEFPDGTPAFVAIPWQTDELDAPVPVWDEDGTGATSTNPLIRLNQWMDHEINVDLDNNTFEWIYGDQTMVTYGTREWDSNPTDSIGPALSSVFLIADASNSDANADGITGSTYYDDFVLTEIVAGSEILVCDGDADGDCDLIDIDLLYQSFGTDGAFDLDGSGTIDADDIDEWLVAASSPKNTYKTDTADLYVQGDVNLDGDVNSSDLGLLLNNFGHTSEIGWNGGDVSGDGTVNSTDLGLLLNNFGSTSQSTTVPEPASLLIACFSLLGVLPSRRKR